MKTCLRWHVYLNTHHIYYRIPVGGGVQSIILRKLFRRDHPVDRVNDVAYG